MENKTGELSLSLRIPTNAIYVENALLTLEGICEHCNVCEQAAQKAKNALEGVLNDTIEIIQKKFQGVFELGFDVADGVISITVNNIYGDGMTLNEEFRKNIKAVIENKSYVIDEIDFNVTSNGSISYRMQFRF